MSDEHTSFIRTPKQLVIAVVLAFAIPIAVFLLLTQLVTGLRFEGSQDASIGALDRIKPVGELTIAAAGPAPGTKSGEQVYQTVCKTCHEAGLVGAPKFGDKAAWAPRIKKGVDVLFNDALKGTAKGMPPKGGSPDLADIEVERGVVYMANHAGASFKEPAAPPPATPAPAAPAGTAAPATAPAATPAPAGTAAPAAAPAAAAAGAAATQPAASKPGAPLNLATGQAMMQKDGCAACHAVDKKIVGPAYQDVAAKYHGDSTALAKLTQKVKAGGAGVWGQVPMPPNSQVPDADIKALVSWILTLKK